MPQDMKQENAIPPSIAPSSSHHQDDLFLHDRFYAKHGKLTLLTIVIIFSLFLTVLIIIPYRRRIFRSKECLDSNLQYSAPSGQLKGKGGIQQDIQIQMRNKGVPHK